MTTAKRIGKIVQHESGKVLVMALVLLVMGSLILAPLLGLMSTGLAAGRTYDRKASELHAADAGVEAAIHWLIHGKQDGWGWEQIDETVWLRDDPDHIQINGKDVEVTVEQLELDNKYKVTSRIVGPEPGTTVMSTLWAIHVIQGCYEVTGPHTVFDGDVHVTEDMTITVGGKVEGDLVIGGDLTMEQSSEIEGDVSVSGNITMEQSTRIYGDVCASGDLELNNYAQLRGDVFVGGDIIFHNNTLLEGTVFIMGNIIMNQKGDIYGDVYAYGDITITLDHPNAVIHGDVYSTGTVTVDPESRVGNIDSIYEGCDPSDYPEQPDCPQIPANPTQIYTYEIS